MNTRLLRLLRARRGLLKLLRERPISGAAFSVLAHVAIIALVLWFGLPMSQPAARRGEALFVELPRLPEPAPRGNPALRERGPDGPPEPARPAPPAPAPKAAPPTPRAAAPASKAPPAPARPAPSPAAPKVASAPPAPAPAPAPQARPAEPSPPDPSAAPAPAPPAPAPEARAPQPPPPTPAPPPPPPASSAPGIAWPPKPQAPGPAVASIPGGGAPSRDPAPDMRSALRRGGGGAAGGARDGRGGIEGEPIPLDSKDPKYSDYLDRVRELIKSKWIYPCVPNPASRQCEYKSAALEIEFGIAKDGRVPFVIVRQASQFSIYDEYAVNAIKLASPFPPVPDDLSKKGIPILARFNYVLESYSLTNLLR